MNADLNTSAALAVIFDLMTWVHHHSPSVLSNEALAQFISKIRHTFGCFDPEEKENIPSDVQRLLSERATARTAKDFATSDALRAQIRELGFEVRDEGGEQTARKL